MTEPRTGGPAQNPYLRPDYIFLVLALVFGIGFCIFVPYGAGFDEETHIVRIYDISGLHFFPNQDPPFFKNTTTLSEFHDMAYQRRNFQNSAADMFSAEALSTRFSRSEESYLYGYLTNSIYSPVIFAPQAVIARLSWRNFNFPILPVVMLMRIAGLLMYVAGATLAIRALPFGKWAMLVLALAPMALFQAATLNTDGFTNATSFLFLGVTLYLWANPPYKPGAIWAVFGSMLLLGSGKPGSIILLPLLFLLAPRNFRSRKWIAVLLVGAGLAVAINLGWTWLALGSSRYASGSENSLSSRAEDVLSDIPGFISGSVTGISLFYVKYIRNWLASYGYWVGTVPEPVFWFYPLGLLCSLFLGREEKGPSVRVRVWLLAVFLLSTSAIVGSYFAMHYDNGSVGSIRQGRYVIPFTPLLFVALSGWAPVSDAFRKTARPILLAALALTLGLYSFGLYATYFNDCGYSVFVGEGCTLPVYKNLDTKGLHEIKVNAETPLRQGFIQACTGMTEVRVDVESASVPTDDLLRMSLLDANGKLISAADFYTMEIKAGQELILPVKDVPGGKGEAYTLLIEAPGAHAPAGVGISIRGRDVYPGELQAGGEPVKDDLLFHYSCTGQ